MRCERNYRLFQHGCSVTFANKLLAYMKDTSNETLPEIINAAATKSKAPIVCERSDIKDIIQLCLCYCNTDDGNWPRYDWINDSFCQCRAILQQRLSDMNSENQLRRPSKQDNKVTTSIGTGQNETMSNSRECTSSFALSAVTPFRMYQYCKILCSIVLGKLKSWKNSSMISHTCTTLQNRLQKHVDGTLAISLMTLVLICYRYRYRMTKTLRAAFVMAIAKPIQEILLAIRNQ
jgi:hypothetical protein